MTSGVVLCKQASNPLARGVTTQVYSLLPIAVANFALFGLYKTPAESHCMICNISGQNKKPSQVLAFWFTSVSGQVRLLSL
jgi:hypothetical protein